MGILLFVVANLIVLFSAIIIGYRLKLTTISDRILTVFIIAVSQILLTELFLGVVIEKLYLGYLLAVNAVILFIVIIILRKTLINETVQSLKNFNIKELILQLVKSPLVIILSIIGIIQIGYIVYMGYSLPPYGWDEIWYHLTAVASWHQEGKIFMLSVPSIWSNPDLMNNLNIDEIAQHMSIAGFWYNVYPMNSELISLWNIIFWGNDSIVDLTQLPFALIGSMAVYSLARKMGLKEKSSVIAGILFLFTPIIIIQSRAAYVDITFGVLTIIAVNYLIGFMKYQKIEYAVMTAITSGLVLGTKSSGIAFAGFFIILLLVIDFIYNKKVYNLKRLVKYGLTFGLIVLVLGGFWYFRNMYYYGNPIYPYTVKIGDFSIFKGLGTVNELIMIRNTPSEYLGLSQFQNILSSWFEKENYYSVDIRKAGLGPLWIILEVPSILFLIFIGVKKKLKPILVFIMLFAILFIIHPANWWTRYTLFIVALGSISLAYLIEYFSTFTKFIVSMVIVFLSIYTVLTTLPYISTVDLTVLKMPYDKRTIGSTFYSDYLWVDEIKENTIIGHTPMTFTYPLFSSNFRHKVYLIDANTEEDWINKVHSSGIDYITVLKGYLDYEKWIVKYPKNLTNIYNGWNLNVYKINRD